MNVLSSLPRLVAGLLAGGASVLGMPALGQVKSGPMPGLRQLDSLYAVHGLAFGTREGTVAGLQPQFAGLGKRWKISHVYTLQADTATLGGQKVSPELWFRGARLSGATYLLSNEPQSRLIRRQLIQQYGPPRPGNVAGMIHWLGQRTYITYEDISKSQSVVTIASLYMLNEQVFETSVRQEARQYLGWQPDSLGLPRQFALPAAKKKKK